MSLGIPLEAASDQKKIVERYEKTIVERYESCVRFRS